MAEHIVPVGQGGERFEQATCKGCVGRAAYAKRTGRLKGGGEKKSEGLLRLLAAYV